LLDALEVVIDLGLDEFVISALDAGVDADLAFARAANEIAGDLDDVGNLSVDAYVATLLMEQSGDLSATQAKTVLGEILTNGGDPASIAQSKGFERLDSGALGEFVAQLIEENPDEWSRYRSGDEKLAQFFIGQVMKLTKGQANGKDVIAELQARR
jgi:aspartyl-tRNA(Asn)/glutamyl-tRNA(Gln) amidotransferase subunit B